MNKICIYFGFVLFGMILFLCGCKKEPGAKEKRDFHLAIADSLLNQFNAVRDNWDWSFRTEGNVIIKVEDNMISIEHNPEEGDHLITYFLQTVKKERQLKAGSFGRAEVIFLDRALLINSLEDEKTLLFSISVDPEPYYLKSLLGVKQFKGIGLGVRKINKTSETQNAPYCSCEPVGSNETLCGSGGSVALSCITGNTEGSCRVSCSGQTFACCDMKSDKSGNESE